MESTDREILISIQGQIHRIIVKQGEQDKRLDRIESRLGRVELTLQEHGERIAGIEGNLDAMKWGISIGFGVMGALIALSTLIITALPFLRSRRENPPTNENAPALIQSIIDLLRFTRESEKH